MIIEIRITPAFEHIHLQGIVAQLCESTNRGTFLIRAQRNYGMSWMEVEPTTELKDAQPYVIDSLRANLVLDQLLEINLPAVAAKTSFDIHETSYEIKVFCGTNSCEFSWSGEVPSEWQALATILREVQSMAEEALSV